MQSLALDHAYKPGCIIFVFFFFFDKSKTKIYYISKKNAPKGQPKAYWEYTRDASRRKPRRVTKTYPPSFRTQPIKKVDQ